MGGFYIDFLLETFISIRLVLTLIRFPMWFLLCLWSDEGNEVTYFGFRCG